MIKRGRGRPPKVDPNRKKISVDQAVEITKEHWAKYKKAGYSKGYIYNLISAGELHAERHGKGVLLFEDEVRKRLCA